MKRKTKIIESTHVELRNVGQFSSKFLWQQVSLERFLGTPVVVW